MGELAVVRADGLEMREQVRRVMEMNSQLTFRLVDERQDLERFRTRLDDVVAESTSLTTAFAEVASVVACLAAQQAATSSDPEVPACPPITFAPACGSARR